MSSIIPDRSDLEHKAYHKGYTHGMMIRMIYDPEPEYRENEFDHYIRGFSAGTQYTLSFARAGVI